MAGATSTTSPPLRSPSRPPSPPPSRLLARPLLPSRTISRIFLRGGTVDSTAGAGLPSAASPPACLPSAVSAPSIARGSVLALGSRERCRKSAARIVARTGALPRETSGGLRRLFAVRVGRITLSAPQSFSARVSMSRSSRGHRSAGLRAPWPLLADAREAYSTVRIAPSRRSSPKLATRCRPRTIRQRSQNALASRRDHSPKIRVSARGESSFQACWTLSRISVESSLKLVKWWLSQRIKNASPGG
mmetsp:Transcript_127647/g.355249  ORF Transcript_127647/g.355249 Transcript_127647/m.355249 type:complete len:247 (+) Transcript_127647:132-872(+)